MAVIERHDLWLCVLAFRGLPPIWSTRPIDLEFPGRQTSEILALGFPVLFIIDISYVTREEPRILLGKYLRLLLGVYYS